MLTNTLQSATDEWKAEVKYEPVAGINQVNYASLPTAGEVDWAAQHLSDMPIKVSFSQVRSVTAWCDAEGGWWRTAGIIFASPGAENRFHIWLYRGATEYDLKRLKRFVAEAREGFFTGHGWDRSKKHSNVYRCTLAYSTGDRPCGTIVGSPILYPCSEPRCDAEYHSQDDSTHLGESVQGEHYFLRLEREELEPWSVFIDCTDGLTPREAVAFSADLQRLSAEAVALNSKMLEVAA